MAEGNVWQYYNSSFEKKYCIYDNLDESEEPIIRPIDDVCNSEYVCIMVVVRGTLQLVLGGIDVMVKANDFLLITPCVKVVVKESRCLFFSCYIKAHLMPKIYTKLGIKDCSYFHAFKFMHAHFSSEEINILLDCYRRIKKELERYDYPLKECTLRAYQTAFLAKLLSIKEKGQWFDHAKNTRYQAIFDQFLEKLHKDYKTERSVQYYADSIGIATKYLSSVVYAYTRLTASQTIDQYVVLALKQALYLNACKIKEISEEFNFPNQSFFGRYFKRVAGMTPNEYIKFNNIQSICFYQDYNEED
ncbi:MAG: helix-turn-helix domain-containing protein [Bacteroidaceae bacterium]|nr:helix-turn-helix domain-containing protein [Bacteroidaceae bacterium]